MPSGIDVLPHYKIITEGDFFNDFIEVFGKSDYQRLYESLGDLNRQVGEVVYAFRHTPYVQMAIDHDRSRSLGAMTGIAAPLRYLSAGGRTFEIEEKLNFLLEETDIGRKAPGSAFMLPFPSIYLHFPKGTRIPLLSSDRTDTVLVGVYINEVYDYVNFEPESREILGVDGAFRAFEIAFFSQGKPGQPADSDFLYSRFMIPDDWQDQPLEAILSRQMNIYELMGKRGDQNAYSDFLKCILALDEHLMKCLLFINSDEAILKEVNDAKEAQKRIKQVINKAKKRKLEQQLKRVFDKIVVSHTPHQDDLHVGDFANLQGSGKRRAHWRRGHFRNQAHGTGRKDRKILWIRPSLVTGDKEEASQIKTYKVK